MLVLKTEKLLKIVCLSTEFLGGYSRFLIYTYKKDKLKNFCGKLMKFVEHRFSYFHTL